MRKGERPDAGAEATQLGAVSGPDARVLLHPFRRLFERQEALRRLGEGEMERGSRSGKKGGERHGGGGGRRKWNEARFEERSA